MKGGLHMCTISNLVKLYLRVQEESFGPFREFTAPDKEEFNSCMHLSFKDTASTMRQTQG